MPLVYSDPQQCTTFMHVTGSMASSSGDELFQMLKLAYFKTHGLINRPKTSIQQGQPGHDRMYYFVHF